MSSSPPPLSDLLASQHLAEGEEPWQLVEHPDSDDGADEGDDPRTYCFIIENSSGLPIQVATWPVRSTSLSEYTLSTHRGTNFHSSLPPSSTISTDPIFPLGSMRGPRRFDPRERWGWVYFDLVRADRRKIHLQAFLKLDRRGVVRAEMGRVDLDSSRGEPMPSGEVGEVLLEGRTVRLVLDERVREVGNVVDDRVKRGMREFPGKGVETSTYVSYELGRASLVIGSEARYHEYVAPETGWRLSEMRSSRHKLEGIMTRYIVAFVERDGLPWFHGHVRVHPITGIARGNGFDSTAETTAMFIEGATLNYGFHDAGQGRHDQIYIYATPDRQSWLGDLVASNPAWLDVPFSRLALAASHDSGMFGPLDAGLLLLIQQGQLGNALANHAQTTLATPVVHWLVKVMEQVRVKPERVINNIALTQKDPFPNQLQIGVRFFDFRPGFCFHDVIHARRGEIHHQHAMVPGCKYIEFLTNVLDFLATHPSEIVFVELKSDGFVVRNDKLRDGEVVVLSMVPSEEDLANCLEAARKATSDAGRTIVVGSAEDLDSPIGELLHSRKRLIIVDRIHHPDSWLRSDSYDHTAYNTDDPASIIAALERTHDESSHPSLSIPGTPARGSIYQLQATPTANIKDDLLASLTYSDSSSLLTFMKPRMDRATYPWLASKSFQERGNVILLNDFVDGVLVEHAMEISRQRAGL